MAHVGNMGNQEFSLKIELEYESFSSQSSLSVVTTPPRSPSNQGSPSPLNQASSNGSSFDYDPKVDVDLEHAFPANPRPILGKMFHSPNPSHGDEDIKPKNNTVRRQISFNSSPEPPPPGTESRLSPFTRRKVEQVLEEYKPLRSSVEPLPPRFIPGCPPPGLFPGSPRQIPFLRVFPACTGRIQVYKK